MNKAPENPLKFREVSFLSSGAPVMAVISTELVPAAHAFQRNVRRNAALGGLPAALAGWSGLVQIAENAARFATGIPFTSDAHVPESKSYDANLAAKFQENYKNSWKAIKKDPALTSHRIKEMGLENIDILVALSASQIEAGLEPILVAILLNAWTAFESLVTDTWETALNFGPKEWTAAVLKSVRAGKLTHKGSVEKSLRLSSLEEYQYDFRFQMGTILKGEGKANFQSLNNIISAYEAGFGSDATNIFDSYSGELVALEAARNLYAHRGGKIDQEFKRRVAGESRFGSVDIDSILSVDGALVRSLNIEAIKCAVDLLAMVDSKLVEYRSTLSPSELAEVKDLAEAVRRLREDQPGNIWTRKNWWQRFVDRWR